MQKVLHMQLKPLISFVIQPIFRRRSVTAHRLL
jgi:hypothetical protein